LKKWHVVLSKKVLKMLFSDRDGKSTAGNNSFMAWIQLCGVAGKMEYIQNSMSENRYGLC